MIKDFTFALCEHGAVKGDCDERVPLDDLRVMTLKYFWIKFLSSQTGDSFEELNKTVFVCGDLLVVGNSYGYDIDQDHKITSLYLGMRYGVERIFAQVESTNANNDEVIDSYIVY